MRFAAAAHGLSPGEGTAGWARLKAVVPEHTWTVFIAEKDGSRSEDSLTRPASKPMPAVNDVVITDGNREVVVERITEPEGQSPGRIDGRAHT